MNTGSPLLSVVLRRHKGIFFSPCSRTDPSDLCVIEQCKPSPPSPRALWEKWRVISAVLLFLYFFFCRVALWLLSLPVSCRHKVKGHSDSIHSVQCSNSVRRGSRIPESYFAEKISERTSGILMYLFGSGNWNSDRVQLALITHTHTRTVLPAHYCVSLASHE